MTNDLVRALQSQRISASMLYERAIKLFDSEVHDLVWLISELSCISAIAKLTQVQDPGITSAFTDVTFERIAYYKKLSPVSFSITSLLRSGFSEDQIRSPGFVSVYDYFDTTVNVCQPQSDNTSSDICGNNFNSDATVNQTQSKCSETKILTKDSSLTSQKNLNLDVKVDHGLKTNYVQESFDIECKTSDTIIDSNTISNSKNRLDELNCPSIDRPKLSCSNFIDNTLYNANNLYKRFDKEESNKIDFSSIRSKITLITNNFEND